jgi:mannose-6-phosphate isomerase-like protein (cupin superfamily)
MKLVEVSYLKQAIARAKDAGRKYYYETGLPYPILSKQEINEVFTNLVMIEKNSFSVVQDGMYENYEMNNDPVNEINRVNEAFKNDKTVICKNLETYNLMLDFICKSIGNNVDAHMYVSPKNAKGFPYHEDDRSVFIFMLHGEKQFFIEGEVVLLQPGDMLYIKQGIKHKAAAVQDSCHISFGLCEQYIADYATSLPIDIALPF